MALYAFDGTWNVDEAGEDKDSNVCKFRDAYTSEPRFYLEGIGTRRGIFGKIVGGVSGAGGRVRIDEAMEQLVRNIADGDRDIDIIGFSRGAALALHFANKIHEERNGAEIRFLGLWDVVASFGIPGNETNIKWTFALPDNVRKCYHAMALDERRGTFPLTRVRAPGGGVPPAERLQEVWFRGVHSDVGGTLSVGLSSITLCWMLRRARENGLPIDAAAVGRWEAKCKADAPITPPDRDLKPDPWRSIEPGDAVHETVRPRGNAGRIERNDPPPGVVIARG